MKEKFKKAQYYKDKIKIFSKYSKEELSKYLKKAKYGSIVMDYPIDLELTLYKYLALLLKEKYPKYCDVDDIIEILSSYGKIYTAKLYKDSSEGNYILDNGNILVYSFVNKLDEILAHELIHKLGFLKFNEDFYNMPSIYLESGTELITNTILDKIKCRESIIGDLWSRSVGVQPRYLMETTLVNQLNVAIGKDSLERSILQGRNYMDSELLEITEDVDKNLLLLTNIKDICKLERKYWQSDKSKELENKVIDKIDKFQERVLEEIWEKRISNVETEEEADFVLNKLMEFSDYRIKSSIQNEKFREYFEQKKEELEQKYDVKFQIKDIQQTWNERYPIYLLNREILRDENIEKQKIDRLAEENDNKKSFFERLFGRKDKKMKKLLKSSETEEDFLNEIKYEGIIENKMPSSTTLLKRDNIEKLK